MTLEQRRAVDACRSLMVYIYVLFPSLPLLKKRMIYPSICSRRLTQRSQSKRKASPQEIFDQCREWAMNPERTIEDLDYGPSQTQAEPSPEDMATQNGNHNNDNSHFSKVVVDQGRQSIRRFGENVKNTIPKIMAPLVAAKDKGKKGGLIAPSHDVGSLGVPRVPMAPPL